MFVTDMVETRKLCDLNYLLSSANSAGDIKAALAELYRTACEEAFNAVTLARMVDSMEGED